MSAYSPRRLCRLITERRCRGGMRGIDPPAVARVYQCLSDGMHGYHQARKVEDTPFPFPYAQMVTVMLALMVFVVPLVAVSKLGHDHRDGDPQSSDIDRHFQQIAHGPWVEFWWRLLSPALGPALCFVTILCYYGLNEVARDLEEPFLYPPNDLPCSTFQDDLNLRLLASAQAACDGEAPFSGFDERTSRAEEEAEAQAAGALLEWVRAAAEPPSAGPSPCDHKPTPLDASQSLPQDDASARSDHPIAAALRRYTDYRSAGWEARRSNRNSILH